MNELMEGILDADTNMDGFLLRRLCQDKRNRKRLTNDG